MADPQTANVGLYQPTRGSDPGTWDSPVNANTGATDSLVSNVATIPLSNAPVTLTTPPNSGAAWSGPYQSQSGILVFTGALTANVTVTLPRPGFWVVYNLCTGAFVVKLASIAPGNLICAPPGEALHIYCDGVNVNYINLARIGEYLFLGASAVPAWIAGCTVPPYLNCDGTTFSAVTYPTLNTLLGGNTLPDLRGRTFAALNQGTGRLSAAGVNGNNLLAAGGGDTQAFLQTYLPAINWTVVDTRTWATTFSPNNLATAGYGAFGGNPQYVNPALPGAVTVSGGSLTVSSGGSATPLPTLQPTTVGGLIMIRAG